MSASAHLSTAWVYKQHMRSMIAGLAKGTEHLTNQFCDNFCALMKMRQDELDAAQEEMADALERREP